MSKDYIYKKINPFLNGYIRSLVSGMESKGLIVSEKDVFRVNRDGKEVSEIRETGERLSWNQIFEFRNVTFNVWRALFPQTDDLSRLSFSKVLKNLEERGALQMEWKRKDDILQTLDRLDNLVQDPEIHHQVEVFFEENNINVNRLIYDLLEFYGQQKTVAFFNKSTYHQLKRERNKMDLVLVNRSGYHSLLLFEFKIRRSGSTLDQTMILTALESLRVWTEFKEDTPYMFLIIFTNEDIKVFDRIKFRFREIMNNMTEFKEIKHLLDFIPVSISHLHLIDRAFENYYKEFIQNQVDHIFKNQTPPVNFQERNDDFLDEIFEVRQTKFIAIIKPVNTRFWRFGFRFAKSEDFPAVAQGRHENKEFADIHLSVGEPVSPGSANWEFASQLVLTHYHAELLSGDLKDSFHYEGQIVTLTVTADYNASHVQFLIEVGGESLGSKTFDLHDFKFCRISAWADYTQFELETKIQIRRLGNNQS